MAAAPSLKAYYDALKVYAEHGAAHEGATETAFGREDQEEVPAQQHHLRGHLPGRPVPDPCTGTGNFIVNLLR